MSEIRLNIIDNERAVNCEVHGFLGDAVVAALTAEPETIEELETALQRFVKWEEASPLARLAPFEDLTQHDAGIMVIDLAARVVAVESSYSSPGPTGHIRVYSEVEERHFSLPYRLSEDWLFVRSIPEYEGVRPERREERAATPPLDARAVLYGRALSEFIAEECRRERDSKDEELFTQIHVKWWMTPRADLRDQFPREIFFAKHDFVEWELQNRAHQWSFTNECPAPLPLDTNAFRYAGFGTHEIVVYYYLVRHLLNECFRFLSTGPSHEATVEHVEVLKRDYLKAPHEDYYGRTPAEMIELERRRVNLTLTAKEYVIDEDCPCCQWMAEEFDTPTFWHLDGCNMDYVFEFSFHRTREEWDAEQREYEEWSAKRERERAEGGDEFEDEVAEGSYDQFFAEPFDWSGDDDDVPF